jgi:hypothetical protein
VNKYVNFEVEFAEIEDEDSNSQFSTAKIQAFASGLNRHNMNCSEEVLRKTASTIYNKPILYAIDKTFDDFASHVAPEDCLISGYVVPDSAEFTRLPDERLALNVTAKIWKRYAPKVIQIFKRDSSRKKVSVEMEVREMDESQDESQTEPSDMLDFAYSGVTLLGDLITEASPGANIQILSFSEENAKVKEAYLLEFGRYEEIDFRIPTKVKENVQEALDLHKKHNRGATSVSLAVARHLVNNDKASPEKIRQVSKYKIKETANKHSSEYISNGLFGGLEGWNWAQSIVEKMDQADKKHISYFEEGEIMPYGSLKDVNPSLKGIDPPISLSQANAIAAQADGIIKKDSKANGWAIAIGNFKRDHKVVDGHWVAKDSNEKEKMAMNDEEKAKAEAKAKEEEEKKEEMAAEKPAEGSPEEEKKETPEEEKKEQEEGKEKMSLDANLDSKALLAMLETETEDYQEMSLEFEKPEAERNYAKMCGKMYSKMCKMAAEKEEMSARMAKMEEENKAYMAENEQLKTYKNSVEMSRFAFEVDSTLKEVEEFMPQTEMTTLREESKNFNMENIEGWKNAVKAKAFTFSKNTNRDENEGILRSGFPFVGKKENSDFLWKTN